MLSGPETETARIKAKISRLEEARDASTDSGIREVIAARIEEMKQKLVLEKTGPSERRSDGPSA
jgi:hypothetical protein